ncbi:MAG: HDOD domain-containing protein [Holophagaceae bacterium]|nr:HDOD domain-containing protein [Holophagaceae bacterium]
MITLDLIRQRVNGLPSLPASVFALGEIAMDERSTLDDVYRILVKDPALASCILRLANSSLLAADNFASDLRTAIQRLGMDAIVNLSRGVAVIRNYKASESLDVVHLWQHSTAVGLIAKAVCGYLKSFAVAETAFLAGLLHDIGKIVLDRCFHEEYAPVLNAIKTGEEELEAERKYLNTTHVEVGAQVAVQWKFHDSITEVIRDHHDPKPGAFLPNIIHYCDLLVRTRLPNGLLDEKLVLNLSADNNLKGMISSISGSIPDLEYLTFRIDDEVENAIAFVQQAFQD